MLLDFIKSSPVLDESSVSWLFETFLWATKYLDKDVFYHKTLLVLPSNEFFPGHSNNAADMAQLMFDKVREYAQLQHWPTRLLAQDSCQLEQAVLPYIKGQLRGSGAIDQSSQNEQYFAIAYNPAQVKDPQAMISHFAQTLAYYLLLISPDKPQYAEQNLAQLSEVVGVFMGFGIFLANSAFNYKNITCGSCRTASTDRNSYLSQYDITYALAIFCVLKGIEKKQVLSSLKSTLRSFFKKAYKEVKKRQEINQFDWQRN